MNVRMFPIVQYKFNLSATSARHSLSGIQRRDITPVRLLNVYYSGYAQE